MLAAFLTTILFSISAVSAARTTKVLDGTEANFWRLCVATLMLAAYAHTYSIGLTGAAFSVFLISGLVGFGVGDLALFQALPRLGSRLSVMLVHCLAAPMAGFIEWAWLGTTVTLKEVLCSITILGGVSLALAPSERLHLPAKQFVPGIIFGVIAALGQGLGAVLSRRGYEVAAQAGDNIDGIGAAYQRIIGGVLLSGVWLLYVKRHSLKEVVLRQPSDQPAAASLSSVWRTIGPWIMLNAIAGPTLGVSCYQWALKTTPTAIVLPIVALTPLVVIPFSRYMEGEKPSLRSLIGGVIAVIGAIALTYVN